MVLVVRRTGGERQPRTLQNSMRTWLETFSLHQESWPIWGHSLLLSDKWDNVSLHAAFPLYNANAVGPRIKFPVRALSTPVVPTCLLYAWFSHFLKLDQGETSLEVRVECVNQYHNHVMKLWSCHEAVVLLPFTRIYMKLPSWAALTERACLSRQVLMHQINKSETADNMAHPNVCLYLTV